MSNQFKVGDTVRYTQEAIDSLGDEIEAFIGHDLRVLELSAGEQEGEVDVVYIDIQTGRQDWCASEHLELVGEPAPGDGLGLKGSCLDPLKAEKAFHLARVAAIDKALSEQAQGDGLARLRSIVEETGYFRVANSFYRYNYVDGISDDSDVVGVFDVAVSEGYELYEYRGAVSVEKVAMRSCFPEDLENWSVISGARFEKARADYEAIVEAVKEAMKP